MKPDFVIKRGMNLKISGKPQLAIVDLELGDKRVVEPYSLDYRRWKSLLEVGDTFARNDVLCFDRKNPEFAICAPTAGVIEKVVYGERRTLLSVEYSVRDSAEVTEFSGNLAETIKKSGAFTLIRQRPFGDAPNFENHPKAVFINAMNSAPFQADAEFVIKQNLDFWEAGLKALRKLSGHVPLYLSCSPEQKSFFLEITKNYQDLTIKTFNDLHPSGNSSVQISKISPELAGSLVWTIRAVSLPLIGEVAKTGSLPTERLVAIGGPSSDVNGYAKIPTFSSFSAFSKKNRRVVAGDLLSGKTVGEGAPFNIAEVNILPEIAEEQKLLGWIRPGISQFSRFFNPFSKLCSFLPLPPLDCRKNGGKRTLVFNGIYEKVLPLNIMPEFLIKSILAEDLEEAVKLGLLEIVPEDFALCEYLCPSKLPLQKLVGDALRKAKEDCLHESC